MTSSDECAAIVRAVAGLARSLDIITVVEGIETNRQLEMARAYSQSIGGLCLLVIRHGKIAYEAYYNGASVTSQQKSWSMAKSFTSAAVGCATHMPSMRWGGFVAKLSWAGDSPSV